VVTASEVFLGLVLTADMNAEGRLETEVKRSETDVFAVSTGCGDAKVAGTSGVIAEYGFTKFSASIEAVALTGVVERLLD
jgi:hypothetical protein